MKTPREVRARAATFYSRNHRAWLGGEFTGLTINLQPPTGRAAERDDGLSVRSWIDEWNRSTIPSVWEDKKLGYLGTYSLPARVELNNPAAAARVAGEERHWSRINTVLDHVCEELGDDVRSPLIGRLAAWEVWDDATVNQYIEVISWLRTHDPTDYYIRELPIFGVDTKWLESRRAVVEAVAGPLQFRPKPQMVELRTLDSAGAARHWACPVTDIGGLPAEKVLIVENHQTFLALPKLDSTVAVFGGGLHAHTLAAQLPGLAEADVLYWGDLDSHGLYILDIVRRYLPRARSVLMDIDTARDHEDLAVEEPQPSRFTPRLLTPAETLTLEFLRGRSAGGCLRIEQERIVFDYAVQRLRQAVQGEYS
ncbi:Wadjet anti-phage system protein JetD domain-containing protein [Corynebacterium timonense]|uniref:Wadjet protein JetD C-terminal domain-containing protein n=1 Tax=Corynebacterium timonense TaxID=441500 RepID=A0A1H1ULY2_9CORY|nr:Wadjet anti-phage system protein JetD domain-containing protein [Corynebacterium timonense]SDS73485.1 hypothetical protein SAMN04488539_2276 [Corynebacterium timonense]